MRKQARLLDDVANPPAERRDLFLEDGPSIDEDVAGRRLDEAVDHLERRRLATAGRPNQHADLPGGDGQRKIIDGARRPLRAGLVALGDVPQLHCCGTSSCGSRDRGATSPGGGVNAAHDSSAGPQAFSTIGLTSPMKRSSVSVS